MRVTNSSLSLVQDLRTPIATIRAGTEVLIRSGITDSQAQRVVRNVNVASLRLQELIEAFVDSCKGAHPDPEAAGDCANGSC